ncbi:GntR family transcriptional regulator [Clostridium sp. AM58-1XD]|uniref:GntR family transcriptional regulator n=1 Tax=Clostridium sp. AM58-1XD TaxID=2292307 RepID=UPI000E476B3A|nr:GntR family transcriptional regulator [Clostridium sp. AM58-1XD]RGY96184.1 GntR family transcriptional regulator [Clostridium sp. AM58-1XD]
MKLTSKTLSSQVKEAVLGMINQSEFMDKLPSEQDLAAQLGVSRNTVREALKALENEGLVISRHGIGTFVTRYNGNQNIRYNISALDSTTKIISEHGYRHGTKSVYFDVRMASEDISKKLGSDTPVKILYVERVRTADDIPIVFVEDYIPYADGMLEEFSGQGDPSLFQFINRYAPVSFANCSIHAVLSDARLMEKLSLTEPKALLLLQQIHYASKGSPVLYSDSYFITEKLEFNLIRRCVE